MELNLDDQQMIIRMERLVAEAREETERLAALQAAIVSTPPDPTSIVNLIDNSDFDWSEDRFLNNPLLGGDIDFEAFNWYRQLKSLTLLVEDAAHALKFTGHSLYAANEGADGDIPRWDRTNGWVEIGNVGATGYDIACPLPENFIRPGRGRMFVQFQASRRTATALPGTVQAYGGFWDNTAGQEKWIEGGNFTLNAVIVGATGATSREYKIIGISDYGAELESNVVTIANAPASLSPSNYIRLTMEGGTGFVQFDIYEKVGGVVSRIGQILNSNDVSFNFTDTAPKANVGATFPTASLTKPRCYAETDQFEIVDGAWELFDLQVPIPSTYNTVPTTGRQWFRMGLTAATTDARQVLIDRIGVSLGFGHWAPSSRRPANNIPSTSPTNSNQNPPIGGGGSPGDGGGGPRCWVVAGCQIPVIRNGEEQISNFEKLEVAMRIVSDQIRPNTLLRKRTDFVDETYLIETANGLSWRFTDRHRLRRNVDDIHGTPVIEFKVGDSIVTRPDREVEISTVTRHESIFERVEVGSLRLGPGHWLWVNGFSSHNLKQHLE